MKKNKYLVLFGVLMIIILSYSVFADFPPDGFPGENCRCKEFCEQDFKCYFGVCDNETLNALNCTNPGEDGKTMEVAEPCPACPACSIWEDCLFPGTNIFKDDDLMLTDPVCGDYYDYLMDHELCRQTVDYEAKDLLGYSVINIDLLLGSEIDEIDYSLVFEYENRGRAATGSFEVPRCSGIEEVTVIATKVGYDADVQSFNITNDRIPPPIGRNFTLAVGTCHVDCTDSYNRCNPNCEGFTNDQGGICSYNQTSINGKNITNMCAYKPIGTDVVLQVEPHQYTVVECCEGAPRTIPRPTYDIRLTTGDNLVSIQKPVKTTNGEQAKLSIFYWN